MLGTKLAFGHYLLVPPLRESVNALQHPDLCWNKESDTYTSCINLDGDALKNALHFEAREKYFLQDITKEEELLAEQLDPLDYDDDYEEDKTMRRRRLLSVADLESFDLSANIGKLAAILGGGITSHLSPPWVTLAKKLKVKFLRAITTCTRVAF